MPATSVLYTLSLHDALPILPAHLLRALHGTRRQDQRVYTPTERVGQPAGARHDLVGHLAQRDRKSTRLNSSHLGISYAVFCLKKKKNSNRNLTVITNIRKHS